MKPFIYRIQITTFILVLVAIPVFWLHQGNHYSSVSIVEGRELAHFPEMADLGLKKSIRLIMKGKFNGLELFSTDQETDQSFQNKVVRAASDQFPFRIGLIRTAKMLDFAMIRLTYVFLPDKAIPVDTKTEIYMTKDQSTVMKGLTRFDKETTKLLDDRIKNLTALTTLYPTKNFYVFYFEILSNSKFDPRLSTFNDLDGGRAFEYFEKELPENITLGKMQLTSMDDFNQYFYHTDHHWNIRGAWKAYQEIYKMVSPNYPEISPMLDSIQFKTYPDLLSLGTYARDTLYPFEPEKFEIGTVDLPPYSVLRRDYVIHDYNLSNEYNAGIFDRDPYVSHYEKYFGTNNRVITYRFDNNATRNLLMFGTSYKIPLQPWIASHYHESYFVNLKEYRNFSLDEFLKQHEVDDIIIVADMDELTNPKLLINR